MHNETDVRLRSSLSTNQLAQERMCLAILSLDKRFSNSRSRHPHGGPDGGVDIEATFEGNQTAYGAVGFANNANDSREQRTRIKSKFQNDLLNAKKAKSDLSVFVFFTNVNLTLKEENALTQKANEQGITHCEIFDRERLRHSLDNTDGLAIRFQYLQISMSEAEQAAFFARWGDDIQSVISTGFRRMESTLNRMLFLQEATAPMKHLVLQLELDKTYSAEDIGHFRLFCSLHLREPKASISSILFGGSDRSKRMSGRASEEDILEQLPGIKHGISRAYWEGHLANTNEDERDQPGERYVLKSALYWSGKESVTLLDIWYYESTGFFRISPYLSLIDIDEAMYLVFLNKSLARRVKAIHLYANDYKLKEYPSSDFYIDESLYDPTFPAKFFEDELCDPWVRIRPKELSDVFCIRFSEGTPKRLFNPLQIIDSLERNGAGENTSNLPSTTE